MIKNIYKIETREDIYKSKTHCFTFFKKFRVFPCLKVEMVYRCLLDNPLFCRISCVIELFSKSKNSDVLFKVTRNI